MPAPRHRAPAGRYRGRPGWGDPRAERRARLLRAGLAVVLGVGVAVAVTSYVASTQPGVAQRRASFEVLSDTEVRVDYEVRQARRAEALCVLRARDADGARGGAGRDRRARLGRRTPASAATS